MNEVKKTILNVVNKSCIAFLSTTNLNGIAETRALANWFNQNEINDKLDLYFTTNIESAKIEQIKKNNSASLYYYLSENMQNMTLFGKLEVITDKNLKDKLWKDELLEYFPDGKDGKYYGIIKFSPEAYKCYICEGGQHKKLEGKI